MEHFKKLMRKDYLVAHHKIEKNACIYTYFGEWTSCPKYIDLYSTIGFLNFVERYQVTLSHESYCVISTSSPSTITTIHNLSKTKQASV